MAKIKHIAIRTTDVEKTVAFYREVFDLKQVGRGLNGIYSPAPNTSQLAARMKARRTLRSLGEGGWKGFGEFRKDTSELCSEELHLSDGHINLAILKYQPEKNQEPTKIGVDHLGFLVEDVEGTLAKLSAVGGKALTDRIHLTPTDPSTPQSYFEVRCMGPDDQVFDVSGSGWVGTD